MYRKNTFLFFVLILVCLSSFSLCREEVKELVGAGASFPYPLYSKWFDVYAKTEGIKVNYQSIGSGAGIQQLMSKTVDFGGTDAFLSEEENKKFEGTALHIPTALGGVAVIYNLKLKDKMRLTPELLSDIFLGKISNWQDERIKKENPDLTFPNAPIIVAHRSDGSGTTSIFTDYLSKVSEEWREKVGHGKSVKWPVGVGGKGNEGVAGYVKQLFGSVGYVEVIYAEKNDLQYALLKNKSGNYAAPDIKSVSEAANVALPDHLKVSITDTDAPQGYPVSGFTWLLVYQNQNYGKRSRERARALQNLLLWCVTTGQQYNETLMYAPLPKAAKDKAFKLIYSMKYGDAILRTQPAK